MTDGLRVGAGSGGARRSGSGLPVWFGVPFLLGGIFAAVVGVVLLLDEIRYGNEGVSLQGTVLETVYFAGGGEDGPSYSIRYEYVDPATGTSHRGESDVSEETFEMTSAGEAIEVTYLPAEPAKSRVGSPEPQLFLPLVVFGMAAIFIVVGVGMILLTLRIRRHGVPSWVTISSGSTSDPEPEQQRWDDATNNPLAAFIGDDAAPAPPPAEQQPPMTDAELRALDARLAPPEDKP